MGSTSFEKIGTAIYRGYARGVARILGASPIVRSIFAHRSVGAGEVVFGRSDIDLIAVVRKPESQDRDALHLRDLYRRVRMLQRINPVLGHIEVHDTEGFQNWLRLDTYRGSFEGRGALPLYGKPVERPDLPVRTEDAAGRLALFPHYFLSVAIRQKNRRNLRKVALEIWSAYATATGKIAEPFLTRRETEEFCRSSGYRPSPNGLDRDPAHALEFIFDTVALLHGELRSPLKRLSEPVVFDTVLPPTFHSVIFVVLPDGKTKLPAEISDPRAVLVTPELLDLYIHYANAFAYTGLPAEVVELGFRSPDREAFERTIRYEFHNSWFRSPGFIHKDAGGLYARIFAFRQTVEALESGELPPGFDLEAVPSGPETLCSPEEYYKSRYAGLLAEQEELWNRLDRLPK